MHLAAFLFCIQNVASERMAQVEFAMSTSKTPKTRKRHVALQFKSKRLTEIRPHRLIWPIREITGLGIDFASARAVPSESRTIAMRGKYGHTNQDVDPMR